MEHETTSPKIRNTSWGNVEVESFGAFKDVKLWPGGAREWNWNETGTSHKPGVQTSDLRELVENGARYIVIGNGRFRRLGVPQETLDWLEEQHVRSRVLETTKAIEKYNSVCASEPVGALIHSTC